jgi:hypothetical protein
MSVTPTWRKSSFSGGEGGECVEVRRDLGAVRDTKNRASELPVARSAMTALIRTLR